MVKKGDNFMWKKIKPYVIGIFVSLLVGGLAAFLTRNNMDIYDEINTPPLSPPAILFPIVWTILYILMGIGAGLCFTRRERDPESAKTGLFTFGISLVVNFFWSIIFFRARAFLFAFIWLLCLLFLILRTIRYYNKVSPLASYLQIPYAVWVTFAGYLNLAIYLLN